MSVILFNGYGRSGSTVIESLLAKDSDIVAVGELRNIWERGLLGYRCSCTKAILDCEFWRSVISEVAGGDDLSVFFKKVEAVRYKYDRIRKFSKILGMEVIPEDLKWYIEIYERIYERVALFSEKSIVLDSSKNPTHAAILSKSKKLNIKNVHLVRHPRAVVYSWSRKKVRKEDPDNSFMPRHPFYKSAALWVFMNLQSEKIPGFNYFLRYEDFVEDPETELRKLKEYVGCQRIMGASSDFHTIGGNPVKFDEGFMSIQPDMEWLAKQGRKDAVLSWFMTYFIAKRYGYSYDG